MSFLVTSGICWKYIIISVFLFLHHSWHCGVYKSTPLTNWPTQLSTEIEFEDSSWFYPVLRRNKVLNVCYFCPQGFTFSLWTLRSSSQLHRMPARLPPHRETFWLDCLLPPAQVDPHSSPLRSVQALFAKRTPLTAEVMWNVREGGNTFFNSLIFGKHLSQMSPLLADLWEGVEWVSPSVQGRTAAFRKGVSQRACSFSKLGLNVVLPVLSLNCIQKMCLCLHLIPKKSNVFNLFTSTNFHYLKRDNDITCTGCKVRLTTVAKRKAKGT